MKTNIAETTDKEINDISNVLVKMGYDYVDDGYMEVQTPFTIDGTWPEESQKKKLGLALFPELLSYHDGKNWVTIPWICVRMELEGEIINNDSTLRQLVRWMYDELKKAGYTPFKDEDSYGGCSMKINHNKWIEIKLFVNPDFPEGFWANHTLEG